MADPLSITASIIAVVGAAEGIGKTFAKIRNVRHAPGEVLALMNEVSDLKIILENVERYFVRNASRGLHIEQLQTLSALVDRAKEYMLELDQLIHYRLLKAHSTTAEFKVSRYEWAAAKHMVERFRQSLRDVRLNLVTQMIVINSSHQSRIALTIDEIYIVSGQIHSSQLGANDRAEQQRDGHSRILSSLLSGQSELKDLLRLQTSINPGANTSAEQTAEPVIGVRAFPIQHQRSPCSRYCKCKCHDVHRFRSPDVFHEIVGTLFIGYSGFPVRSLQKCTEQNCLSQSTFRAYVHYLFPSWFLTKALTATFMMIFPAEVQVALAVRTIVPAGSEIFRLESIQDIDGMKRLFSNRLASPDDSYASGISGLSNAAARGKAEVCSFLLSAGADPHLSPFGGDWTPFRAAWTYIFSFKDAASTTRFRALFPVQDDDHEEWQFSILHKIVLGIVSTDLGTSLTQHSTDINLTDSAGKTALSWAARRGDDAALGLLLEAGADVNITDDLGVSPLSLAARSGSVACTTMLLAANADISHKDLDSFSALHYAANSHHEANNVDSGNIIELLIQASGDPNIRDQNGGTPLYWTSFQDNSFLAALLLDSGADVNTRDNDGDSCLLRALFHGAIKVTQLLLQRGADYTILYSNGDSVLHLAAKSGSMKTLDVLIAAALKGIDPHMQDRDGKTPIQTAQKRSSKPEGFVEKMHELVLDIDARNLRLAQTQRQSGLQSAVSTRESTSSSEVKGRLCGTLRHRLRTSSRQYISQAILSASLVWNAALQCIYHMNNAEYLKLQRRACITLFLGWVLGLATIWLINPHHDSSSAVSEDQSLTRIIYLGGAS